MDESVHQKTLEALKTTIKEINEAVIHTVNETMLMDLSYAVKNDEESPTHLSISRQENELIKIFFVDQTPSSDGQGVVDKPAYYIYNAAYPETSAFVIMEDDDALVQVFKITYYMLAMKFMQEVLDEQK